ncbi:NAD-dependent epimerase/dehydratase family protein [Kaistia terrae]|uniref:UDP-glucose 4-epimerase n=1 Tax=Kaistia terrae TaxID=537017 RepID=A0ABW0PXK2_9HYPH|nr:NAD-dependent epimerase/dehydratase family protein [Kaistia terrae]MCX5580537.1 NAD-dependent epimerase/dehydratase family protein [Kaistia terrae]
MTGHRSRILITGGSGFVGRALVRLLSAEHEVLVFDALTFGRDRFTPAELGRIQLVEGDVRDTLAVAQTIARFAPEILIHLAAIHFIPHCERDPATALAVNVAGTVNLLTAAPAGCRFVLASSGAVYRPDEAPHREDVSALAPSDIYGLTKLQAEQFLRHFAGARGIAGVAARLFNVVGSGETNPHLLPEVAMQLRTGDREVRLGNLWPKRDYIHVEDAAAGFAALALRGDVAPGEMLAVNLGTSHQHSVAEMLDHMRQAAGFDFRVIQDPARTRLVDRPFLAADIDRISERFGWRPTWSIQEAVRDLWHHPDFSPRLFGPAAGPVVAT